MNQSNLFNLVLKEATQVASFETQLLQEAHLHSEPEILELIESIDLYEETQIEPLFEELTDSQRYAADRMTGSGRDYYLNSFISKHPKAKEALTKANQAGEKRGRIRIPVDIRPEDIKPHEGVVKHLQIHGYSTSPDLYAQGLASKEIVVGNPEQGIPFTKKLVNKKIGGILKTTSADEDTVKAFDNDPARRSANEHQYDIILTNHPHDIYGMSTGRGEKNDRSWTSCASFDPDNKWGARGGPAAQKMKEEINNYTHVAYLVKRGGDVDKEAIGRLNFKHHTSLTTGHETLFPERTSYGNMPTKFNEVAGREVSKLFEQKPNELYAKNSDVYNDDGNLFKFPENMGPDSVDKAYQYVKKNVKNSDSRKDYYLGRVSAYVNPGEKYKSTELNSLSKSMVTLKQHIAEGDFVKAASTVGLIHYSIPNDRHNGFLTGNDKEGSSFHDLVDQAASTFDAKNPEHLKYAAALIKVSRSSNGMIKTDFISAVKRKAIYKNPARTHEEVADAISNHNAFQTNTTDKIAIADDHKLGSKPMENVAKILSQRGQLNLNNFHRAYFSLNKFNRKKSNLYDHMVELERNGVEGMSNVLREHGEKVRANMKNDYKGEENAAKSLYATRPENRERLADAIGIPDHKAFVKPFLKKFKAEDKYIADLIKKREENNA